MVPIKVIWRGLRDKFPGKILEWIIKKMVSEHLE